MPTNRKTRLFTWMTVWVVLCAIAMSAHLAAWRTTSASDANSGLFSVLNFINLAMAPGEKLWRVLSGDFTGGGWVEGAFVGAAGATMWTVVIWVVWRVRRWFMDRPRRGRAEIDTSRRRFVFDASLAGAGLFGGGVAANATMREPWGLRTTRYSVNIQDLPESLDGVRFVQVSDTHLGPHVPAEFIQHAIDEAIALKPDMFLLTGDYVSRSAQFIDAAAAQLGALVRASDPSRPPLGVLGNHDWYADGPASHAALSAVGIRMIDNTRVFLDGPTRSIVDEPTADCLCIAGFGDLWEDRIDAYHAFLGVPASTPRLLLSHQPDVAEFSDVSGVLSDGRPTRSPRVDLMLSGHLHGGQVKLPFIGAPIVPSRFGQKYLAGMVQGPAFPVLISRGIGMSVLPIRWGAPPEIVEITLRWKR